MPFRTDSSKNFSVLIIFLLCLVQFAFGSNEADQSDRFSDCKIVDSTKPGFYIVTFICDDSKADLIFDLDYIDCSSVPRLIQFKSIERINFEDCQFREFSFSFLRNFTQLRTVDISNIGLKRIKFEEQDKLPALTHFNVSNNRLGAIPPKLFTIMKSLTSVDFSNNTITAIYDSDFEGADNLTKLDLSHNSISSISSNIFKNAENLLVANFSTNTIILVSGDAFANVKKLTSLDLSNNQLLLSLERYTFDSLTKLKHLDLSCNRLGFLLPDTFMFLTDLEYLSLRQTNMSILYHGLFSYQPKLISLDLSENQLRTFNFKHFIPIMQNLKTLRLNDNELRDMSYFKNGLLPNLSLLDLRNNRFNCHFLEAFLHSFDWNNVNFPVDPNSAERDMMHFRGIACEPLPIVQMRSCSRPFGVPATTYCGNPPSKYNYLKF